MQQIHKLNQQIFTKGQIWPSNGDRWTDWQMQRQYWQKQYHSAHLERKLILLSSQKYDTFSIIMDWKSHQQCKTYSKMSKCVFCKGKIAFFYLTTVNRIYGFIFIQHTQLNLKSRHGLHWQIGPVILWGLSFKMSGKLNKKNYMAVNDLKLFFLTWYHYFQWPTTSCKLRLYFMTL